MGTGTIAPGLRQYLPFQTARAFVRGLGLKGNSAWRNYCKGNLPEKGALPPDIPAAAHSIYSDKGWAGYGDWLGTGTVATRLRRYRSFEDAKAFVRGLDLKSQAEWGKFCEGKLPEKGPLPSDIPAAPQWTYADNGWTGIGDWLGTGNVAPTMRRYRTFKKARAFARCLDLRSQKEWFEFCKGNLAEKGSLPPDIPAAAQSIYADKGWAGYGDWLGTGNVAARLRQYRKFHDARAFVHNLALNSASEWIAFCKGSLPEKGRLPSDIPANPHNTYADIGWAGMGNWLGTGTVANSRRQFRPFLMARAFARGLKLKGNAEWREYCNGNLPKKVTLPLDIPTNPHRTYAKIGWVGYGDWLGTGNVASFLRQYRPFNKARYFARGLGLKSGQEWMEFCKGKLPDKGTLPRDIPAAPQGSYADKGWAGMGDWLGTGNVAPSKREYRAFNKARAFVCALGLKSQAEWKAFCKGIPYEKGALPSDIPSNPNLTYADKGWTGYGDWLGTSRTGFSRSIKRP
ncbi:MAG: hypothetical protein WCK77_16295 [Verrucomicrobiota bacterium]